MSEQDKRAVYMGTFERHRKEVQIKQEDILSQIAGLKLWVKYSTVLAGIALGIALVAIAI